MSPDLRKKIQETVGKAAADAIHEAKIYVATETMLAIKHLAQAIIELSAGRKDDADRHFKDAAYHVQQKLNMEDKISQMNELLLPEVVRIHPGGMEIDL